MGRPRKTDKDFIMHVVGIVRHADEVYKTNEYTSRSACQAGRARLWSRLLNEPYCPEFGSMIIDHRGNRIFSEGIENIDMNLCVPSGRKRGRHSK